MFAVMCVTVVFYTGNVQESYIIRNTVGIRKSITLFNLSKTLYEMPNNAWVMYLIDIHIR